MVLTDALRRAQQQAEHKSKQTNGRSKTETQRYSRYTVTLIQSKQSNHRSAIGNQQIFNIKWAGHWESAELSSIEARGDPKQVQCSALHGG